MTTLGAKHVFIRAHCPWQNGQAERYNRTPQVEWAYRQIFLTNAERTAALVPWLEFYNTGRRHSAIGGLPRSAACHERASRVHLGGGSILRGLAVR